MNINKTNEGKNDKKNEVQQHCTSSTISNTNLFKEMQVKYRKASTASDASIWNELVDFSSPHLDERIEILRETKSSCYNNGQSISCTCCNASVDTAISFELCSPNTTPNSTYQGPVYGLHGQFQGFAYLPQALSSQLQLQIATMALEQYCKAPHRTNLDDIATIQNKSNDICSNSKLRNISWSTMGYHYNWTTRSYCDEQQSTIPLPMVSLCHTISESIKSLLNQHELKATTTTLFHPQACIVNYYNTKSLMGGHVDDLEYNLNEPVISISVGCSAVFLLGGYTKEDSPVIPILVRSGDVMIMGGASRLRYHGMARILPTLPTVLLHNNKNNSDSTCCHIVQHLVTEQHSILQDSFMVQEEEEEEEQTTASTMTDNYNDNSANMDEKDIDNDSSVAVSSYLSSHRININVRQVLSDGVNSIQEQIIAQQKQKKCCS